MSESLSQSPYGFYVCRYVDEHPWMRISFSSQEFEKECQYILKRGRASSAN